MIGEKFFPRNDGIHHSTRIVNFQIDWGATIANAYAAANTTATATAATAAMPQRLWNQEWRKEQL